jgi:hypothetical protein
LSCDDYLRAFLVFEDFFEYGHYLPGTRIGVVDNLDHIEDIVYFECVGSHDHAQVLNCGCVGVHLGLTMML